MIAAAVTAKPRTRGVFVRRERGQISVWSRARCSTHRLPHHAHALCSDEQIQLSLAGAGLWCGRSVVNLFGRFVA